MFFQIIYRVSAECSCLYSCKFAQYWNSILKDKLVREWTFHPTSELPVPAAVLVLFRLSLYPILTNHGLGSTKYVTILGDPSIVYLIPSNFRPNTVKVWTRERWEPPCQVTILSPAHAYLPRVRVKCGILVATSALVY